MATGTMTTEQKLPFSFQPRTSTGQPATIDGQLSHEVVSGDVTVEMNEDGLSGFILAGETVGAAQVKFTADADLSDGIRHIEELADLTITNAEAFSLGITFGEAVPK